MATLTAAQAMGTPPAEWDKVEGNVVGTGLGGSWLYDPEDDESTLTTPPTVMP